MLNGNIEHVKKQSFKYFIQRSCSGQFSKTSTETPAMGYFVVKLQVLTFFLKDIETGIRRCS